jgi:hypothetical protein
LLRSLDLYLRMGSLIFSEDRMHDINHCPTLAANALHQFCTTTYDAQ